MNSSLISVLGVFTLIFIAFLLSSHKKAINLRTVFGAFVIQFLIGAFVLYTEVGIKVLSALSDGVSKVIAYGNIGTNFIFGGLVSDKMFDLFGEAGGFIFALKVLPIIIFFSSLIAVLYYLGLMQIIVKLLGGVLSKFLGTSRAESTSAAANIFVGQTEAPLVIKPYISKMTESELFAVMCGGLASVSVSVLFAYSQMGIPMTYLLAASFMAAPGSLLFAKLMLPETHQPQDIDDFEIVENEEDTPVNVLDAAATGASTGMKIAVNVGAMLLAFVGLMALLNGMVGGVSELFGKSDMTIQKILGWIFSPLAWVVGASWEEAEMAGSLIGQKLVVNEFVAYAEYANFIKNSVEQVSVKTQVIIAFALCGFANFSSIAILVGGLGVIAPNRRKDVARLGIKAVIAGSLSNLMSAAIAGLFIGLSGI